MDTHQDGPLSITKFDSLGPYGNNAYLIADRQAGEAIIVDMPSGSRAVLDAIGGLRITSIVLTHTHPDHWADYDLVKNATRAPVLCNPGEVIMPASKIDRPVADGDEIAAGKGVTRAVHTPGHTPGSTCYLAGRILFSGDVLFPGGPGRTQRPADLQQSIRSITGTPLRAARRDHRPPRPRRRHDDRRIQAGVRCLRLTETRARPLRGCALGLIATL